MPRRHSPGLAPLPGLWLLTDERADGELAAALGRLPRGAGVIFRHHHTPTADRRIRYEQVRRIARARGLHLLLAGPLHIAVGWRADGAHGRSPHRRASRPLLRTAPAHCRRELVAAGRVGATGLLSPTFATRSHPGGTILGPIRFGLLARGTFAPPVALGGMNGRRFRRLAALGASGWAAIDAWHDGA